MTATALNGALVFDGENILEGRTVIIDGGRIAALVRDGDVPSGVSTRKVEGILAPGFIDVQVNGGGGVLFNDEPTVEGIRAIGATHRRFGTTGFLPTVITDTRDRMAAAIGASEAAIAAGVPGVLGVHVEGPFINPDRKGAHDPAFIRTIEEADIALLTAPRTGRTLITLAPETVPADAIVRLATAGCLISAGHTNATYEQVAAARNAGLAAIFTTPCHRWRGGRPDPSVPPSTTAKPGSA
jgi:N-acetylglucosamine-6-phosphate deacetylase